MPSQHITGLMSVKNGQKQQMLNISNAREIPYSQYSQMTDEQKKGVIIVDDYPIPEESDSVSVTADGVKTYGQLLNELYALVDMSKVTDTTIFKIDNSISDFFSIYFLSERSSSALRFTRVSGLNQTTDLTIVIIRSNSVVRSSSTSTSSTTFTNNTDDVPTSGTTITLIYDYYKNLDIHTEYLAKNCMLTGGGNVEDDKVSKSGDTMQYLSINRPSTTTSARTSYALLGNNVAEGNIGNSYGLIYLYGKGTRYTQIDAPDSTENRTIHLPNASGTLALTSDIPTTSDVSVTINTDYIKTNSSVVSCKKYGNIAIIAGYFVMNGSLSSTNVLFTISGFTPKLRGYATCMRTQGDKCFVVRIDPNTFNVIVDAQPSSTMIEGEVYTINLTMIGE